MVLNLRVMMASLPFLRIRGGNSGPTELPSGWTKPVAIAARRVTATGDADHKWNCEVDHKCGCSTAQPTPGARRTLKAAVEAAMLSPYGMEIVESCLTCKLRSERIFCNLPTAALQTFEDIKFATAYPPGAVLFVEGQM